MDQIRGITSEDLRKLLRENQFSVSPQYLPRVLFMLLLSNRNSRLRKLEEERFADQYTKAVVKEPVFILGHWRSGTTLLHNLISRDQRFTFPNIYQVSNPHSFLSEEDQVYKVWGDRQVKKRVTDNMVFSPASPSEDEFAISSLCQLSPLIGWSFPKRMAYYDRFLMLKDVSVQELELWKQTIVKFFQKLTWKKPQPLLLKSPTHTGRIKLLLELFPDARFINIHRNPYQVFQSTLRLFQQAIPRGSFQTIPGENQLIQGILDRYQQMYQAYFEQSRVLNGQRALSEGTICDISFEQLEENMLGTIQQVYQQIGLDNFQQLEPKLLDYINSLKGYQKNDHRPLPDELRQRVFENWQQSFQVWNYPS